MLKFIQYILKAISRFVFRVFVSFFRESESPRDASNPKMLLQFRDNLQATFLQISRHQEPEDQRNAEIRERIKLLLDKPDWASPARGLRNYSPSNLFTWNDAYQAEKLLAHLRPEASLKFEITKQIFSLRKVDPQAQALFQETYEGLLARAKEDEDTPEAKAERLSELQNLLERILNDVHWKYAQRYYNRKILERYTYHVSFVSCVISALFLVALFRLGQTGTPQLSIVGWAFSGLEITLLAGAMGACFSILTGNKISVNGTSLEETLLNTGPPHIALRLGVGCLSAIILYFGFESGVLVSDLLPDLDKIGFSNKNEATDPVLALNKALADVSASLIPNDMTAHKDTLAHPFVTVLSNPADRQELAKALATELSTLPAKGKDTTSPNSAWQFFVPNADLSKLLIWSFAAGFFEKLVPKALQRVSREGDKTQGTN